MPRTQVGRYVLGELLGRGAVSEVFAARVIGDHGFQKPVAVKRYVPALAKQESFVAQLVHEANRLVSMEHGKIVRILDLVRDEDDVFLVTELVDGPSLRGLRDRRRRLPLGVATYIVQAAAEGLAFAHGRAIVHGAVSARCLLLTRTGEVRVADFGSACRGATADAERASPGADIFALGAVLYEALCGVHPLGGAPEAIVPPRQVEPSISPRLEAICLRALSRDPGARYAGIQALIDDLVEERFAQHWWEGAPELAALITEAEQPRARTRGEAITIATRSLLARRPSAERVAAVESPPDAATPALRPSASRIAAPKSPPDADETARRPSASRLVAPGQPEPSQALPAAEPRLVLAPIVPRKHPRSRARSTIVVGICGAVIAAAVIALASGGVPAASGAALTLGAEVVRPPAFAPVGALPGDLVPTEAPPEVAPTESPPAPIASTESPPATVAPSKSPPADITLTRSPRAALAPIPSPPAAAPPLPPSRATIVRAAKPVRPPAIEAAGGPAAESSSDLYRQATDLFVRGSFSDAEALFKHVLANAPGHAPAHRGLGFVYQRLGITAKALAHLRRYLELAPNARDRAAIQARLEKLESQP